MRQGRCHVATPPNLDQLEQPLGEAEDSFYAAWVEEIVCRAVDLLASEYCRQNQADRIRVLYGRLCEELSIAEVSAALNLKASTVDFYFRDARDRLSLTLQAIVRPQVERYCNAEQAEDEFAREWERLGSYLATHGGLDEAVRRCYARLPGSAAEDFGRTRMAEAIERLRLIRAPADKGGSS
jgi:hypothetical protein